MTAYPGFGVLLIRLLEHRGTSIAWLSSLSGVPESELRPVAGGVPPTEPLLRALAPALGFHAADLFVIANVPVPEDLTPLDPEAGKLIGDFLSTTMALPPDQRLRVHRLIEQLPQELRPHAGPAKPPRTYVQQERGVGAMLVSMLCTNRNLHSLPTAARTVAMLTRGEMYLSAATYPSIGHGHALLRPDWVVGFAATLGIPAGDLAAITGIELPDEPIREDLLAAEMAELIWNLRRLSAAQTRRVCDEVEAMLVAIPDDAPREEWNRVHHQHGTWWGAPRTPAG